MNIEELEARFEEIDELSASENIKIGLSGTTESDGAIRIDLTRGKAEVSELSAAEMMARAAADPPAKTVLKVDLKEVNIPDEYIREKINFAIAGQTASAIPDVVIREIDTSGNYELMEDYTYEAGANYKIIAKSGFVFDRASIPRIFWVIISKDELSNVAPVFHDLLYEFRGVLPEDQVIKYRQFTRARADELFYEIMIKRRVRKWRAYLAYLAVKNFGQTSWDT